MPTKSPAQRRLMQAAAHDPTFAKKTGVPQKVAREFVEADKGKHKGKRKHKKSERNPHRGDPW